MSTAIGSVWSKRIKNVDEVVKDALVSPLAGSLPKKQKLSTDEIHRLNGFHCLKRIFSDVEDIGGTLSIGEKRDQYDKTIPGEIPIVTISRRVLRQQPDDNGKKQPVELDLTVTFELPPNFPIEPPLIRINGVYFKAYLWDRLRVEVTDSYVNKYPDERSPAIRLKREWEIIQKTIQTAVQRK
jgi:hypothetical protein